MLPPPTEQCPTKRTCLFWKGEHNPNDCNVVTDKRKRFSIVRDARVCFNCLNRHSVSKCKSRNRCKVCHRKHHTSLCQNVETPPPVASNGSATTNKISGPPTTDKTAAPSVSSHHISDTDRHTPTMLQTAVLLEVTTTTSVHTLYLTKALNAPSLHQMWRANLIWSQNSKRQYLCQPSVGTRHLLNALTLLSYELILKPLKRRPFPTVWSLCQQWLHPLLLIWVPM